MDGISQFTNGSYVCSNQFHCNYVIVDKLNMSCTNFLFLIQNYVTDSDVAHYDCTDEQSL